MKNVVLVMSGKGGVGKSTVAANLALASRRAGRQRRPARRRHVRPERADDVRHQRAARAPTADSIQPLERFGIKLMSIGFLLDDPKTAIVWRGPMLHGALIQFLADVDWGELDYLLLDLPPGTGDVALTLSQTIRTNGAVIVTTPQEVALQDVYKSVSMCQKVGIPILGVVENESYFVCDGCSKRHELFGCGRRRQGRRNGRSAPLLGQIPHRPGGARVGRRGDAGGPGRAGLGHRQGLRGGR